MNTTRTVTFVITKTGRAFRITSVLDIHRCAHTDTTKGLHFVFAQMQAYQVMSDEEMLTVDEAVCKSSTSYPETGAHDRRPGRE